MGKWNGTGLYDYKISEVRRVENPLKCLLMIFFKRVVLNTNSTFTRSEKCGENLGDGKNK